MSIFSKIKNSFLQNPHNTKEQTTPAQCSCGGTCSQASQDDLPNLDLGQEIKNNLEEQAQKLASTNDPQIIKILGAGCKKCHKQTDIVLQAIKECNLKLAVEHVTDFTEIAKYGVMTTPALVINNKVVASGKVLSCEQVKNILQDNFPT